MKPEHSLILALDIGTSSTRALLYTARGRTVEGAEVQISYHQTTTADGGVETSAAGLYDHTIQAIRRLLSQCEPAQIRRISGVGVSCFWHSLMGVDSSLQPITPLYSWADTRSHGAVAKLAKKLDAEAYHKRTGCFLHPSYWPAKLLWLQETRAGDVAKVRHWVSFADYLFLQLFGETRTSLSMASSTGIFDQNARDWDDSTFAAVGISRRELLMLVDRDAAQTGFQKTPSGLAALKGVPWFPALGDGATSNLGAGGASERRMVINLGTSGAIRVMAERDHVDIPDGLFCYRADSRRVLVGGAVSNGGNAYAWLSRTLQLGPDPRKAERRLLAAEPGAHGLTVLPFWAGERSPGWHANATAAILGMNLHTSPLDLLQASLESIAFTFAGMRDQLLSSFPNALQIVVSGGALEKSPAWAQIFADVLGTPVQICRTKEPSGRGAALFTAQSLGLIHDLVDAPDALGKVIRPHPRRHVAYQAVSSRFRSAYDLLVGRL